jgi:hypothetical protein
MAASTTASGIEIVAFCVKLDPAGRSDFGNAMARIFISPSSKNNHEALAFHQWLLSDGLSLQDIFLDVDGIGAGERWRDALKRANVRCEAVILLASSSAALKV